MSVWFITGASRGFGRQLADDLVANGHEVVATARKPETSGATPPAGPGRLVTLPVDVTDRTQVQDAIEQAVDTFGRIDVLVNNAGYGLFGSIEQITDADARELFDTNVHGMLNVLRAALPTLRRQGSGHIINISSSAGFAAGAGRGLYGASKAAVESISEALREELASVGVRVTIVEPGSFRTDFLSGDSRRLSDTALPDYDSTVGALLRGIEVNNGKQPGDPAKAVAAIRRLAELADPPLRLQLGSDCVRLVESKLASVRDELERWRDVALSTDYQTT